jgi:thiamine-phosphate pyrophosphorylase
MKDKLKLYLVLETDMLKMPLEEFIPQVVENGVTAIQLRDKNRNIRQRFETGQKLKQLLAGKDVLFCINDRIDLAMALEVDCVHLGVKDIPLHAAAESFPYMLYGYSCNCKEDIQIASTADYIGIGPAFFTGTKSDLRPVIGADGIKSLLEGFNRPAVAIGGINADNILDLKGSGIEGVAVSSAICAANNPAEAARILREKAEQL